MLKKLVNLIGAYPKKITDANYIRSVLKQIV